MAYDNKKVVHTIESFIEQTNMAALRTLRAGEKVTRNLMNTYKFSPEDKE